jgi:hypothetical protein
VRTLSVTTEIAAPPERVWDVMRDIDQWPAWTSVTRVAVGPTADGRSRATLGPGYQGVLGGLWLALTRRPSERYLAQEARGLTAATVFALGLLLLPVGVPAALGAQAAAPLQAGARVRVAVHGPDPRWRVGTLGAVADTVLVLRTSRGSLTIPARDVVRLQASRGTGPSVLGGVVGVLLGGAAGGAGGCLANRDDYGVFCGGQRDTRVVLGAVLGGAAGAVVGAVALRRERWQAADWPPGRAP